MRILVVVDGKPSIVDCGRLARSGARPRGGRATIEADSSMPGLATPDPSSPDLDGEEARRCDAEHEPYHDEGGEG
jgi:hypothetical protein